MDQFIHAISGQLTELDDASTPEVFGGRFNVSIWGTFEAEVQLERSFDGTNWLPITAAGEQLYVWTAPASEQAEEAESRVKYRLKCTDYTSGTIHYRISQ